MTLADEDIYSIYLMPLLSIILLLIDVDVVVLSKLSSSSIFFCSAGTWRNDNVLMCSSCFWEGHSGARLCNNHDDVDHEDHDYDDGEENGWEDDDDHHEEAYHHHDVIHNDELFDNLHWPPTVCVARRGSKQPRSKLLRGDGIGM